MAKINKNIYVKVLTFDPAQGKMIPVPNARLLIEDKGWLWDPDLSDGSHTTDANGMAQIEIAYEESEENNLNPFFTITLPEPSRTIPSGAPAQRQFELPQEWVTRHYVNQRIRRITEYTDSNNPLKIFIGLYAHLLIAYTDFQTSGIRNPIALPEDTARVHLSDYDDFLWIDWLNPDDTLKGFGFNPKTNQIISIGQEEEYPYFDIWPTAQLALDSSPSTLGVCLDPPGAPVGTLGGGSFQGAGPVAVDPNGFLFMIDANVIRRFYPDGTLCETIAGPGSGVSLSAPKGLALDQYRNLFVSNTGNHTIEIFSPDWIDGGSGRYQHLHSFGAQGSGPGQFESPFGLTVVPNRVVDGKELLAVADSQNSRIQVLNIDIPATDSIRCKDFLTPALSFFTQFGKPAALSAATASNRVPGELWEPVGIASDREQRLFVCDRTWHRVSLWRPAVSGGYEHVADWESSGGLTGSGAGEFDTPEDIAVDMKNKYVYVAESGNNRVQRLDADTGNHLLHWEHTYTPSLDTDFEPTSVAVDTRGDIYVADTANQRIIHAALFNKETGVSIADNAEPEMVGQPWTPSTEPAHMNEPAYVCYGPDGRLWVSDSENNRVLVFERNPSGELVLATERISADLQKPVGLAIDPDGNVFVVDSGNHRVRHYDPSLTHQTDHGTGTAGSGPDQFNNPRGIAYSWRDGPVLYIADRDNDRIKILRSDGTVAHIPQTGSVSLNKPEDVAVDSEGNIYVADTENSRIVHFDSSENFTGIITILAHNLSFSKPCGVSVDHEDKLIVTDRVQGIVFRVAPDGTLLSFWDLKGLLRQKAVSTPVVFYYPELKNQLIFNRPTRAVVDSRGLMAVADTKNHRIRLVRIYTDLSVNLFNLGEALPDISFRAYTKSDWSQELGLKVTMSDITLDVHDFIEEPTDDFSLDKYEKRYLLKSDRHTNAAINTLKVARTLQKWYKQHSREADEEERWGTQQNKQTLNIDLNDFEGSMYFLDVNLDNEGDGSPHGRGADAWDDSVVAHEMSHWVFTKKTFPYPLIPMNPFRWARLASSHWSSLITSFDQALSEGWAEYVEHFWGDHFGSSDRIRGFGMPQRGGLTVIAREGQPSQYLFGGSASNLTPSFDDPGKGLQNEGYCSNALYQIHRALIDPGVLFADSPSYWHGYNIDVTQEKSRLFSNTIWKALRRFKEDPPFLDRASKVFLAKILDQFHIEYPDFAQIVQSIFELNNQLMPAITITEGTSDTTPGSPVDEEIQVNELDTKEIIIQVTDATGRPLRGYNLHFHIHTGNPANYSLRSGPGPRVRHGKRPVSPPAPPARDLYRATNVNGIINLTFEATAGSGGTTESVNITYQPDFDTDDTFSPPEKGDDLQTTLRRLYLYELRASAKTWSGIGNNFGAKISKTLRFNIQAG